MREKNMGISKIGIMLANEHNMCQMMCCMRVSYIFSLCNGSHKNDYVN